MINMVISMVILQDFLKKMMILVHLHLILKFLHAGGQQSGFSAPDNLTFDREGNLWTVTDISSSSRIKASFLFKNNGLFVIPTIEGKDEWRSIPICFCTSRSRNDWSMLYTKTKQLYSWLYNIQGKDTEDLNKLTSKWPHRTGDTIPRPAVVAISGF